MTTRPWFRWLPRVLLVLGIILFGVWSRAEFDAYAFQLSESVELEAAYVRAAAGGPAQDPPGASSRARTLEVRAQRAGVLGRLEIPRLRITAIVAEGVDTRTLGRAVGHVPTTAHPGEPGNCALAGHRDTFLRGLGNVRVNDAIRIVTPDRTYHYEVEWTEVVEPRRIDVLDPTPERSVTLVTCYPFHYIGHAPKRFIVRARQVDAVAEIMSDNESD